MINSLFFSSSDGILNPRDVQEDITDGGSGDEVEWTIFREGRFQHPWYGTLDFDSDFLENMVSNHKSNILQRKVGFDAAHEPSNGAVSWIEDSETGLFLQEETFQTSLGTKTRVFLKARSTLTPWGKKLVDDKIYRYFSSEVDPNYSSGEIETFNVEGKEVETVLEHGPTLIGGGIVMRPYIPNLGPVSFNDKGEIEQASKDIALFKSQGESGSGIFMFKDFMQTMTDKNKPKKFFQFSSAKAEEVSEEPVEGSVDSGSEAHVGEGDVADTGETYHFNESDQGEEMKFTEVLNHVRGLATDKEKVSYLEEVKSQFAEGDSAEVFSEFLSAKKQVLSAQAEAEDAVQRKMQFENQVQALEAERIKMANDLREAREGSRQAGVKQFSAELREAGHTEAVVKEVEALLTGLPSESYSQSFSVKSGREDEDLNLTFKDMISRVLAKLPKEATPLAPSANLEGNQEFSSADQSGAQRGETEVDPNAGTEEQNADEEDDSLPQNVIAFSARQGYIPVESQWDWIDEKGVMHIGGIKQ